MSKQYETEITLGRAMFGHAQLGDKRRSDRAAMAFDQVRRHPGGTLPEKLNSPADLKALYRLCNCEDVTHAALLAAMRGYVFERIAEVKEPVLLLHDATELDYTTLTSIRDDLGQIGKGTRSGYICQNVLAVAAEGGEVLGLVDQILHCRANVPKKETLAQHRARETRESLLWLKGTTHLPADAQLIDVADQGASTFEFLEHEYKSGRRFVIRNGQQRKVYAGHEPVGQKYDMKEHVGCSPELGRFTMDVQAQRGRKARQGAEFIVRAMSALVCYKDVREIDILEDKKGEDPTKRVQKNDLMRLVTKGLNRNERLIIILYYYEELTMKEIGATLHLSESRVSQMHSSIVQRLQNQLNRRRPEFG